MSETTFDYIIVGAGTAGCLLANRLSADASKRVLLIEAGRRDDYHWIHIPVGYLHCIGNPRTDWMYHTQAEAGLNGRALRYPRGKTLGGCSSINGMIYMRGQARDYDQWAQLVGDPSWGWAQSLPYFMLHEDHHGGANAQHGARGTAPALMGDTSTLYRQLLRHHNAGGEWCRLAFRPPPISTAATTKAWATLRSTKKPVGAGTPPRLFCAPPATRGPTSSCGPRPRWPSWR